MKFKYVDNRTLKNNDIPLKYVLLKLVRTKLTNLFIRNEIANVSLRFKTTCEYFQFLTRLPNRWDDITNLLNQKRMFGIECQRSEENVQFYFDDPEAARYVWKLAVLQVKIF